MGSWFVESLCLEHDVAVFDHDKSKLRYFFGTHRFVTYEQIGAFQPEMVINAVSLQHTVAVFDAVLPYLPDDCILADITSVKNGLPGYYLKVGRRFVSTHPMFGPTFASLKELSTQSAIIISESCNEGKEFFHRFYGSLGLNIYEYTFDEHDRTTAYSLSTPFVSTLVFAACMKPQDAPGTTFKKAHAVAKGLMSEDNYLLSEILFNPYSIPQMEAISQKLTSLMQMVKDHDTVALHRFFEELRQNV